MTRRRGCCQRPQAQGAQRPWGKAAEHGLQRLAALAVRMANNAWRTSCADRRLPRAEGALPA